MQRIKQFLQGKKTYLSAALIALVACIAWWIHAIGYTEALSLLGVAGGMAGLGAKSQRTAEAILAVLGDIQQAQAKIPPGQKLDTKQLAADLGKAVFSFAQGGAAGNAPVGAVSNVVPLGGPGTPLVCMYCGQSIYGNSTVCLDTRNTSAPDTVGNRHHAWLVPMAVNGGTAK